MDVHKVSNPTFYKQIWDVEKLIQFTLISFLHVTVYYICILMQDIYKQIWDVEKLIQFTLISFLHVTVYYIHVCILMQDIKFSYDDCAWESNTL